MTEMILSAKQLLILASEMNAEHFYGVRDPFWGMTTEEIRAEYPDHMDTLEKKGYLSMGFDDKLEIAPQVRKMVRSCSGATRYISVDKISSGAVQPRTVIYLNGEESVKLVCREPELELKQITAKEAAAASMEAVGAECKGETEQAEKVSIGQEVLASVAALEDRAACKQLVEEGCTEAMAKLLVSGLKKQGNYCTISRTDLEQRSLQSFNLVYDKEHMLWLSPEEDTIDRWVVQWITRETLSKTVVTWV